MYIKNPNKKVSYSFRIQPETLENLKTYANATNNTVPEIINELITEKLDGVTLTNDYLTQYNNQKITIPDLETYFNNTNIEETLKTMDLQNSFNKGTLFNVERTPNNLDVWDNSNNIFTQNGYTSYDYPNTLHEGIEFVLAPELLKEEHIKKNLAETQLLITNTVLLPIWFKVNFNKTLEIELITFREAINKVRQANNFKLSDKLSEFKVYTDEVISKVLYGTPQDQIYSKLVQELNKLTAVINTGNIVIYSPNGKKIQTSGAIEFTTDDRVNRLIKENKQLKKRLSDIEDSFKNMEEILKKIDDLEERKKTWENIKS